MKREKGGNLLDFMNVELMLEHVLTVMLVTPSQTYEKRRDGRRMILLTFCFRILLSLRCLGVVSFRGHTLSSAAAKAGKPSRGKATAKARGGGSQRRSVAK